MLRVATFGTPQVEELQACCPVLCPDIIPSGYDTQDLIGLMQQAGETRPVFGVTCREHALWGQKHESASPTGRERVEEFETLLVEAGRGVSSCCICGADGHPSTSGASEDADSDGDEEDDDESELHFTVLTGLDFSNRSVVLQRAGVRGWGLGVGFAKDGGSRVRQRHSSATKTGAGHLP